MKVRYRVVEGVDPAGEWMMIGAIVDWPGESSRWRLRPLLQHTVSRPIWREIERKVRERGLTLETYSTAMEDYSSYYRCQREIQTIEAKTASEIRRALQERYVFASQPVMV